MDPCETCVNYPPSTFGGKPCCVCEPDDPYLSAYERRTDLDKDAE